MGAFNIDSAIFVVFLVVNIFLGIYSARGVKTIKEYAVGDGKFSSMVIAATLIATWISGSGFITDLSETYRDGLYYIFANVGYFLFFFIIAYWFAPRLGEFIGKLSIADAMGSLYGDKVRTITAIASCIGSGGLIAAQLNVAGMLMEYAINIPTTYGVLIAAIIVGMYSALGGVKAVTFTDVIQVLTFGIIIPFVALVIFKSVITSGGFINIVQDNPQFDYKKVFDFSQEKSFNFLLLFLYFAFPDFSPAIFQRVAMAKNTLQISKSFIIAGFGVFFMIFTVSLISFFIISGKPDIKSGDLLRYLLTQYGHVGLTGLILSGIMAMVMSTADSFINSTSVILVHDLLKPLAAKSRFNIFCINNELLAAKIASIFITALAVVISILGDKNLLKLTLSTSAIYVPLVLVPFLADVFGFRTSGLSVLIAMFFAFISIITLKILNYDSVQVMFISMGVSAFCLFFFHYILRQPGGFVGIKDPEPLNLIRRNRKKKIFDLVENIRTLRFLQTFKDHTPSNDYSYVLLGFFCLVTSYILFFTLDSSILNEYNIAVRAIYFVILSAIVALVCHPFWSKRLKENPN